MRILSVNAGVAREMRETRTGWTGIDKRPVSGPVQVAAPSSGSGVAGDAISDTQVHGGPDQAVYAYAREDLDAWQETLGVPLGNGVFGENLTTSGVVVNGAEIGERWRIGSVLLEVSAPRTPCRTFAAWLSQERWIKTFTRRALPGAYLRVLSPGLVSAGDPVVVESRPGHGTTVAMAFRGFTTEPDLLPRLATLEALPQHWRDVVASRL